MDEDKIIKEITLLLLYLTAWEEKGYGYDEKGELVEKKFKRAWKNYSFDALDDLAEEKLIVNNYKSKSLALTEEGEALAKELYDKYGGRNNEE